MLLTMRVTLRPMRTGKTGQFSTKGQPVGRIYEDRGREHA
jgi:hypothetical protein